jgi:siroheme synthase-like protein
MENQQTSNGTNLLFPVFLKLDKLQVLIVGGGNVGTEKLHFMLKSSPNAQVNLVAPEIADEIQELAASHPSVQLIFREFEESDLENIDIVIVATENRELNLDIRNLAKSKKIITNVADTPDLCDFYLGSIVTKGDLKIAISTNGKSPTFSKRFRMMLEEVLPDELPQVLNNLRTIRDNLKGDFNYKIKKLNEITENLITGKN